MRHLFKILILLCLFQFSSCKKEVKKTTTNAVVKTDTIVDITPKYLYVTAVSGLTLRSLPNLESEKLIVMPLGTKVRLLNSSGANTMNIGGIEGKMLELEYDSKKGFSFSGFLSEFLSAQGYSNAKRYAEDLKKEFRNVIYSDSLIGPVSNPVKTETLILPTVEWHKAFFTAQQLFGIPRGFAFPNPKGANRETQQDGDRKPNVAISELHILRSSNELQEIEYIYKSNNSGYIIQISKQGSSMKINRTELVD